MNIADDFEYLEQMNKLYWVEQEAKRKGMHPSQIVERIEEELKSKNVQYGKVTFIDYPWAGTSDTHLVDVYLDNDYFRTFDYKENKFV